MRIKYNEVIVQFLFCRVRLQLNTKIIIYKRYLISKSLINIILAKGILEKYLENIIKANDY